MGASNWARSLTQAPTTDAEVVLGIRPEDLDIVAASDGFPFRVRVVEPLGSHTLLTGHAGEAADARRGAAGLRGPPRATRCCICGRARSASPGWMRHRGAALEEQA